MNKLLLVLYALSLSCLVLPACDYKTKWSPAKESPVVTCEPKFAYSEYVEYVPDSFYRRVCSGHAKVKDFVCDKSEKVLYMIEAPYDDRIRGCKTDGMYFERALKAWKEE